MNENVFSINDPRNEAYPLLDDATRISQFSPSSASAIIPNSFEPMSVANNNYTGPYDERELNAYFQSGRKDLIQSIFDTDRVNRSTYIADMKINKNGNIVVLGGFDSTIINNTLFVSQIITDTGNEIDGTQIILPQYVGFFLEYDPRSEQVVYGTILESPSNNDVMFGTFEFDQLGNVIILGNNGSIVTYFNNENLRTDNTDLYLLKLDGNNYDIINQATLGGANLERIGLKSTPAMEFNEDVMTFVVSDVMAIDSLGNIIIGGSTTSFDDTNLLTFPIVNPNLDPSFGLWPTPSGENAFIMKVNADFTIQWSRMYTGSELTATEERVSSVVVDDSGKIYIGGSTTSQTLPTGLFFPQYDTKTNGEPTINHQRTIPDGSSREAFIAVFNTDGSLYTATYLGSNSTLGYESADDYIYDLEVVGNALYVAGETTATSSTFPYISPYEIMQPENMFDDPFDNNANAKTGFILTYNTVDYNITYSHRFIVGGMANAITEIEVINGNIYFTGLVMSFRYVDLTVAMAPGYIRTEGVYADDQLRGLTGRMEREHSSAFLGVINSSRLITYLSNVDDLNDLYDYSYFNATTNLTETIEIGTVQSSATGRMPFVVSNNSRIVIGFEDLKGISLKTFKIKDKDNDGLSDWSEPNIWGTNGTIADTDGDNLLDGNEVYGINSGGFVTDPLRKDTDEDCLNDDIELENGLNPTFPDQNNDLDGDGINSIDEVKLGLDVNNNDTDFDGLDDFTEVYVTLTNGSNPDSDYDGLNDKFEVENEFDPWDWDMDNDGILDGDEYNTTYTYIYSNGTTESRKTDLLIADTDQDGLLDGLERDLYLLAVTNNATNPVMYDSDYDGLSDKEELIIYKTPPTVADIDADGLNDSQEVLIYGTAPFDADIDNDLLNDTEEVLIYGTDPWNADIDGDGLDDYEEVILYGTNPWLADEDGDGLNDLQEITYGSNPNEADTDLDGLPDLYEYTFNLNSSFDETQLDLDGDSLTTMEEYLNGTHPTEADIDNDQLNDYQELFDYNTNPWNNDTDGDGLLDYDEIFVHGTSPLYADSDSDGLNDSYEISNGLNATNFDTDGDFLNDGDEIAHGTDPKLTDTDNDGILDGQEIAMGTDPLDDDSDGDGLLDGEEVSFGTNPSEVDTDFDGLDDFEEINLGTDATIPDTDSDGLFDGYEVLMGYNPKNNDSDSDTLLDGLEELVLGTDPMRIDTDADGMPDAWEVQYMSLNDTQFLDPTTNDASSDPDGDGLNNADEYSNGTDPRIADTDQDGVSDGDEVDAGSDPLDPSDVPSGGSTGPLRQRIQEGLENEPLAGWSAAFASLLAIGIFSQMAISWFKNKGGKI